MGWIPAMPLEVPHEREDQPVFELGKAHTDYSRNCRTKQDIDFRCLGISQTCRYLAHCRRRYKTYRCSVPCNSRSRILRLGSYRHYMMQDIDFRCLGTG